MDTLRKRFKSKYGIDAFELVEKTNSQYFDQIKSLGLQTMIGEYAKKNNLPIDVEREKGDEFGVHLVEAFAEAGERFPQNQKWFFHGSKKFFVTPQNPSVPKSKGDLEDYKNIVSKDDLRPVMTGVYISKEDKAIVGTDAHKMFIWKTPLYSRFTGGGIIDIKTYIGTKGNTKKYIDGKYPNYNAVIPQKFEFLEKNFSVYAIYNLCYSAIALNKLIAKDSITVHIKHNEKDYYFNPIILGDTMQIALKKGYQYADIKFDEAPSRAWLFEFSDGSKGLCMPIMAGYADDTQELTLEDIAVQFREEGKSSAKKQAPAPKSKRQSSKPATEAPNEDRPYKKFEGSLADVEYVPRREIKKVILRNGQELSNADIIDGVYKIKSKYAHGGKMDSSDLIGRTVKMYMLGVDEPEYITIKSIRFSDPKFDKKTAEIEFTSGWSTLEEKQIGQFLAGETVTKLDSVGDPYTLMLMPKTFAKGGTTEKPQYKPDVILVEGDTSKDKSMEGNWLFPANPNKKTMGVKLAKGGRVNMMTGDETYRISGPANSIEKDILQKVNYNDLRPYFVGTFGWRTADKNMTEGYLFNLDDLDKTLVGHFKLKENEMIFRYFTRTAAIGGVVPFIKINIEKALLYFIVGKEFGDDHLEFETKAVKADYITLNADKLNKNYERGGTVGGLNAHETVYLYVKRALISKAREQRLKPIGLSGTDKEKEVIASLISKGYLNAGGAITEKGKIKAREIDTELGREISGGFINSMNYPKAFEEVQTAFMAKGGMTKNQYVAKLVNYVSERITAFNKATNAGANVIYLQSNQPVSISKYENLKTYSAQKSGDGVVVSFNAPQRTQVVFSSEVKEPFEDRKSYEKYGGLIYKYEPLTESVAKEILTHIESEKMVKGGVTKKEFLAKKVGKVMSEYKAGTLRSGSGAKVTKRDQAIAIGLSEGRQGWRHKSKKYADGGITSDKKYLHLFGIWNRDSKDKTPNYVVTLEAPYITPAEAMKRIGYSWFRDSSYQYKMMSETTDDYKRFMKARKSGLNDRDAAKKAKIIFTR